MPLLLLFLASCKGTFEQNAVRVPDGNSVILVGTASLAIIITTMNMAAAYISPVLLALFLAILFTPILRWLQKKGLHLQVD